MYKIDSLAVCNYQPDFFPISSQKRKKNQTHHKSYYLILLYQIKCKFFATAIIDRSHIHSKCTLCITASPSILFSHLLPAAVQPKHHHAYQPDRCGRPPRVNDVVGVPRRHWPVGDSSVFSLRRKFLVKPSTDRPSSIYPASRASVQF